MLPFNAQVFLSLPLVSKSWPDSVGAVSASKAEFQSEALWRPVALFQITSGAVDIKIAFIYWLLFVPTVAQITTLLSWDNQACVDLCCSYASGASVHFSSKFIGDIEHWRARVYESQRMTMIVCLHWGNLYRNRKMLMCLMIWWHYRLETFILEQIRTMAFLWQSLALSLTCKCGCKGRRKQDEIEVES